MNKLSKSAVVLIVLAVAAIALGVILFIAMPESLSESFGSGHGLERGTAHHFMLDGEARRSGLAGRASHMGGRFILPFLLILAAVLFFVFRALKSGYTGRKNHSRAILDGMYAEEKITLEEYRRKRTVLEEDN